MIFTIKVSFYAKQQLAIGREGPRIRGHAHLHRVRCLAQASHGGQHLVAVQIGRMLVRPASRMLQRLFQAAARVVGVVQQLAQQR